MGVTRSKSFRERQSGVGRVRVAQRISFDENRPMHLSNVVGVALS